jgi:hypothetical protein
MSEQPGDAPFVRLAIEYWRLLKAFEKSLATRADGVAKEVGQVRYAASKLTALLAEVEMRLVTFDGQRFEPGLPVGAINAEDFEGCDELIIVATVEPTLVLRGEVQSMGRVVLDRAVPGGEG